MRDERKECAKSFIASLYSPCGGRVPLPKEVKRRINEWFQLAIEKISREEFTFLTRLGDRLEVVSEIFPDELWSKELIFASMVIAVMGLTIDRRYKKFTDYEKERVRQILKTYVEEIGTAVTEEDVSRLHSALRDLCFNVYRLLIYGLGGEIS